MLLTVTQEPDLSYSAPINEPVMKLRMAARWAQARHRLSFRVAIGPAAPVTGYFVWLGNLVHAFTINAFHDQIRIVATSVVETDRPLIDPATLADPWPIAIDDLDYAVRDYLRFGESVVDHPTLRELAASVNPRPGMPLGDLALTILRAIDERFAYEKGVTTATSPITEILQHHRGVCQDFTHLMIGLGRALGVPARYVSGFLHPEGERYRGYTQTHAWCELYFPSTGWVGFDPTNKCMAGSHFVRVAVGRDYRDVPPNRGIFKGVSEESMSVEVHSQELPYVPQGLPAERIEALGIETFQGDGQSIHDTENLQVIQQQQQQQQ